MKHMHRYNNYSGFHYVLYQTNQIQHIKYVTYIARKRNVKLHTTIVSWKIEWLLTTGNNLLY